MQLFTLFAFSVLLLQGIVVRGGVIPGLIADALAGAAVLMISGALLKYRRVDLTTKYALYFTIFSALIVTGWFVNNESPGAAVAGIRYYLSGFVFCLLPLVYRFTDKQLFVQLILLLGIGMVQTPMTVLQRFVIYRNVGTGDVIGGTLGANSSGVLSMFLAIEMAVLVGFYVKGKIPLAAFLACLLMIFIPTTLNETKVTFVLIPVIFLAPYFFAGVFRKNKLRLVIAGLGVSLVLVASGSVYQYLMVDLYGRNNMTLSRFSSWEGISDFLQSYMAPQMVAKESGDSVSEPHMVGRVDKIVIPLQILSKDPVTLLVGYGVGNTAKTPIDILKGEYVEETDRYIGGPYLAKVIWETGLLGASLFMLFLLFVFRDARYIAHRHSGLAGTFAFSWQTGMIIVILAVLYGPILAHDAVAPVAWFYIGFILSLRARIHSFADPLDASIKACPSSSMKLTAG